MSVLCSSRTLKSSVDSNTIHVIELGHGKSTPDHDGLLWLPDISESEKSDLVNLIKTGEDSILKRAWLGLAEPYKYPNYGKQYENAEVLNRPSLILPDPLLCTKERLKKVLGC